jgi:hypothetical protein
MADTTTQQPEVETDAQALASAQAGYDRKARGTMPPAEAPVAASGADAPLADQVQTPPQDAPGPEESDLEAAASAAPAAAPDPIAAVTEQLGALRAQVQELASAGGAAAEVRKLHGEIGNINRTLKKLEAAKPADAPAAEDELAAALKQAEAVAEEFPEIAGPLVKALKAFHAKSAQATPPKDPEPASPADTTQAQPAAVDVEKERLAARQQAAIDALNELHPDRLEINKTPDFKKWLATKPPEYQKKVNTSWNPAVLSSMYDEFKASVAARTRRQERLEAAAQPQGTGASGPTTIPDEEGARIGYKRARRL